MVLQTLKVALEEEGYATVKILAEDADGTQTLVETLNEEGDSKIEVKSDSDGAFEDVFVKLTIQGEEEWNARFKVEEVDEDEEDTVAEALAKVIISQIQYWEGI